MPIQHIIHPPIHQHLRLLLIDRLRRRHPFLVTLPIRVLLHVRKVRVEDELLLVEVSKREPEDDRGDRADDSRRRKRPDEVRVADGGCGAEADGGGDGGHGEVDRGDEAFHVLGGARVGDAVGGDVDEDLGDGGDDDGDRVQRVRDRGDGRLALGQDLGARGGVPAAGGGLVHVVLQHGVPDGADGAEREAEGHARDGAPFDAALAEERVDDVVHQRYNCMR